MAEHVNILSDKLDRNHYWEVFEPLVIDQPEPLSGSIADDLAGIWRDVKAGLIKFDSGKPGSRRNAVWHWRFSMESHWGHHAAGAIVALNALCFGPNADVTRRSIASSKLRTCKDPVKKVPCSLRIAAPKILVHLCRSVVSPA